MCGSIDVRRLLYARLAGVFHAVGGPTQLAAMIDDFRTWADRCNAKVTRFVRYITRHTHSFMLLAYLAPAQTKIDLLSQSYGPSGAMNSGTVRK